MNDKTLLLIVTVFMLLSAASCLVIHFKMCRSAGYSVYACLYDRVRENKP